MIIGLRSQYPHVGDVLALTLDRVLDLHHRLRKQSDHHVPVNPHDWYAAFERGDIVLSEEDRKLAFTRPVKK